MSFRCIPYMRFTMTSIGNGKSDIVNGIAEMHELGTKRIRVRKGTGTSGGPQYSLPVSIAHYIRDEHVILDPGLPFKINHPILEGSVKSYFRSCQEKRILRARRLSSCSLVCISRPIPICLNTHTWHVGVHNLIMNNYVDVVQHLLHHNPPTILPFGLHSPIGLALQRYTFSSALGPPCTSL